MKRYSRLIFVDLSDTGRAPMAKLIMKEKMQLAAELEICSRGLVVLFSEPINQKAEAVLISNGIDPSVHRSSQLVEKDFGEDVLVLCIDDAVIQKLWKEFPGMPNIYTLKEYICDEGEHPILHGEPLVEYGRFYEDVKTELDTLTSILNEIERIGYIQTLEED